MIPTRPILLAAFCAAFPVHAMGQTGPSLNCAVSSGLVESMVCSDATLGAMDGQLADQFDTALSMLEAQGEEAEDAVVELLESQQEWVDARDSCRGDLDPRACVERTYAARQAELVTAFELEEPAESASYTCQGAGGDAVSISFYDLDMPAVRIEGAGDEPVTGTASMTPGKAKYARASGQNNGAKYELSSGQEVWVRKDLARFIAADGTTVNCVIDGR